MVVKTRASFSLGKLKRCLTNYVFKQKNYSPKDRRYRNAIVKDQAGRQDAVIAVILHKREMKFICRNEHLYPLLIEFEVLTLSC